MKDWFEILKGKAWKLSRGENRKEKKRREKVIDAKLEGCCLHVSSYHKGDTEMIQTPTWKVMFGH
jgi:hypothetical protein